MSLPALSGRPLAGPVLARPQGLVPPAGFAFVTDSAGRWLTDDTGAFLIVETKSWS